MNKEVFKQSQPIVYHTLSNALKNDTLAHAYLFSGPKGAPKTETALLLVQSMMCKHRDEDGFACQQCDTCTRIANEESIDFFWHHPVGYDTSRADVFDTSKTIHHKPQERIKKKDVLALQEFFESTSAEASNCRVYILEDYDQATPEASNSLLKFLEEPQPGIFGILIVRESSNVLPTIQSRCQSILFRPASTEEQINELKKAIDEDSATMLTKSGYTMDQAMELIESDAFEKIKTAVFDYIGHWQDYDGILKMQMEVFPAKGTYTTRPWVRLWVEWILYCIKNDRISLSLETKVSLQLLLVENLDVLRSPVDLSLFLDRLYSEIRKVIKKEKRREGYENKIF